MRIKNLEIQNFKAIKLLALEDLSDMVIIAGPNGCGKSSIFDAVRLFKTMYGGYQPQEMQSLMNEFLVSTTQQSQDMQSILQDKIKASTITLEITMTESEKTWLKENASDLWLDNTIKANYPSEYGTTLTNTLGFKSQIAHIRPDIFEYAKAKTEAFMHQISDESYSGTVTIGVDGSLESTPSLVLSLIFGIYKPEHIGVFDYHGAQRTYGKEQIGGISLNIQTTEASSQSALYNYTTKYNNIKSELANGYIRDLISREAGFGSSSTENINSTLDELFSIFFPDKKFMGVRPTIDGKLSFSVRTADGFEHDINDLSSGEKEVLYGYLRLRNSAPRSSVIMIDEPEMHLNPRLIQGLPLFYHQHVGKFLNNQMWLITHSDTLIRQSVGNEGFSVFHMQNASSVQQNVNQASTINLDEEIDRAVMDLVGDLAAYRPSSKVVILEGGGDSDYDVNTISDLFPLFAQRVNLISGGNKSTVRNLHSLLMDTRFRTIAAGKFFAITDLDSEDPSQLAGSNSFSWDRYHIENYFLEPKYILDVMRIVDVPNSKRMTEKEIIDSLLLSAREVLPRLLKIKLDSHVNSILRRSIAIRMSPNPISVAEEYSQAINRVMESMNTARNSDLSHQSIIDVAKQYEISLNQDLNDGKWLYTFRGRDILKNFTNRSLSGIIDYKTFRNLIKQQMITARFQPPGMAKVIEEITKSL